MSHWNNRVVRHKASSITKGDCDMLSIHEVHYDEGGNPVAVSELGVSVDGENLEGLKTTLNRMLACLEKPILDYDGFGPDGYKGVGNVDDV
jgi:hypothetical protein